MIWMRRFLYLLVAMIAAIAIVFLALTLIGWEKVWEQTFGGPDLGSVTFENLSKGPLPNQALVCPDGLCKASDVDQPSPTYGIPTEELSQRLIESLAPEERLVRVDDGSQALRMRFVQRSKLMQYPDTIRVQIIPINETSSTVAIYSQSQVGSSDFGVNLARVQRWLDRLSVYEKR